MTLCLITWFLIKYGAIGVLKVKIEWVSFTTSLALLAYACWGLEMLNYHRVNPDRRRSDPDSSVVEGNRRWYQGSWSDEM